MSQRYNESYTEGLDLGLKILVVMTRQRRDKKQVPGITSQCLFRLSTHSLHDAIMLLTNYFSPTKYGPKIRKLFENMKTI